MARGRTDYNSCFWPQHLAKPIANCIILMAPRSSSYHRLLASMAATLQSIIYYRFKRDHAYCVWIVNHKQLNAYRFMCRTLKEAEDEMYDQIHKSGQNKLFECHIFVTSTAGHTDIEEEKETHEDDLAAWGNHYYADHETRGGLRDTAPFDEADIWKLLKQPSDKPTQIGHCIIHKGRPKWDDFFELIQRKHKGNIIATDLKKACGKFTDFATNSVFLLHKENF
eukprot:758537_1